MKKYIEYFRKVAKHRWLVLIACYKLGIFWQGLVHDLSKYKPSEWFPYVNWFHTDQGHRFNGGFAWEFGEHAKFEDAFNRAWLYHCNHNPHHWQFWILVKNPETQIVHPMPEKFIKELVADWWAAGMAYNGSNDLERWYKDNYDKIVLDPATRERAEELIAVLRNW